jgi:hypothetical protein
VPFDLSLRHRSGSGGNAGNAGSTIARDIA